MRRWPQTLRRFPGPIFGRRNRPARLTEACGIVRVAAASGYSDRHTSNIHPQDLHSGCWPPGCWRRCLESLFLRLEQEETETLAVNRVHPVSGDEAWCGPHAWQDLAGERGGGGWRLRRINRQMHKCSMHSALPFCVFTTTPVIDQRCGTSATRCPSGVRRRPPV